MSSNFLSSAALSSWLIWALFSIFFALMPKRRVERVSVSLYEDGEQLMTRVVLEFPPKLSWSNLVSFESRYGTCED